ncbi:ABC transporter permease [Microterricola viridarii]|uniref:ABC-2 type transport system permease protein n=1 Tax=Microterricola viridarii TaxID=412690 RepID=A0A1H1LSL3_9MICO|nr:hypothetical protein [Microterricola viridarii]SDR77483.1 ABC-2 type transport system permease protein [Microterricola viridarii]
MTATHASAGRVGSAGALAPASAGRRPPHTLLPLVTQRFRRDRVQLLAWVAGFALLAYVGNAAVVGTYGTEAQRVEVLKLIQSTPAVLMLRGTPQGPAADAFQFFLLFAFLGVLIGLMQTFLAVRHSRAEEESGRAELVGATPAGRSTPSVATVIEGVALSLVIGLVSAVGYLAGGAGAYGSWLAGAALAVTGIAFLGVGLFCAQLMRTSRGANGLAAAVVTVSYVLRGLGDATGTVHADGVSMTASWPSWLSPIGWGQAVAPFSAGAPDGQRAWPLALGVLLGGGLVAVSLWMQAHRDVDSSVIPERPGRLHAPAGLAGPIGLAWRLQRNAVVGWMVAGALFGLLIGALGQTMVDLVQAGNGAADEVSSTLGNTLKSFAGPGAAGSFIDLFTAAMFSLVGIIAAVGAVQAMVRARQDEAAGTAEMVLATRITRLRWFASYLVLGALTAVLVLAVAVLGAIVGLTRSAGVGDRAAVAAQAGLAQLPAVLVLLAVVALVFAALPRATIWLGWVVPILAIGIGQFGGLLGLPDAVRDASPFSHTPVVGAGPVDWSAAWVMLLIAVALSALAAVLVRRRDVALGG